MTSIGNRLYPSGREAFANGDIDWEADTLGVVACDDGYTYSDAHNFLDDVAGGSRIVDFTPTGADATDGVLDLADHVEPVVAAGDTVTRVIVYRDSGVEATSALLVYIDTAGDTTPLSVATTGGSLAFVWPNDPNKITRL